MPRAKSLGKGGRIDIYVKGTPKQWYKSGFYYLIHYSEARHTT